MPPSTTTVQTVRTCARSEQETTNGIHSAAAPSALLHEQRVEPVPKPDFPHHEYPRWIGHKFEPDGSVIPFPGNTIICHIPPTSELFRTLMSLYDALKSQDFASLYVMLPPASWHMTVFEGVSDQIRKLGSWPGDLPLDAPLDSCTALVRKKLADFDLGISGSEPPFRMSIDGWEPLEDGIALKVVPATEAEEKRLRQLRGRLSEVLQMNHPGHGTYSFHVSISYMLRHLDEQQHQKIWGFLEGFRSQLPEVFELGAPEFCVFNDMFAFDRQFSLEARSN